MSRKVEFDLNGDDSTCMKVFDALLYPCDECDREDCDEREKYNDGKRSD